MIANKLPTISTSGHLIIKIIIEMDTKNEK